MTRLQEFRTKIDRARSARSRMPHQADDVLAMLPRGTAGTRVAVAVVVALMVVLAGWFSLHEYDRWSSRNDADDARSAATQAAATIALDLSTMDSSSIKTSLGNLIALSTGTFRQQLVANQSGQISAVQTAKVVSKGRVDASGVVNFDGKTVAVALAITANVTDSTHKTPQTDLYRVTVHLVKTAGKWTADSVEFIQ